MPDTGRGSSPGLRAQLLPAETRRHTSRRRLCPVPGGAGILPGSHRAQVKLLKPTETLHEKGGCDLNWKRNGGLCCQPLHPPGWLFREALLRGIAWEEGSPSTCLWPVDCSQTLRDSSLEKTSLAVWLSLDGSCWRRPAAPSRMHVAQALGVSAAPATQLGQRLVLVLSGYCGKIRLLSPGCCVPHWFTRPPSPHLAQRYPLLTFQHPDRSYTGTLLTNKDVLTLMLMLKKLLGYLG